MRYKIIFGIGTLAFALFLAIGWGVEKQQAIIEAGVLMGFLVVFDILDEILHEIKKGSEA